MCNTSAKVTSWQPSVVLIEYIDYVHAKIDTNEVPLTFGEWASIEQSEHSPISNLIVFS